MKTLIALTLSLFLTVSVQAAPKAAGGDAPGAEKAAAAKDAAAEKKGGKKGKGQNRKKGKQDNRAEPQDPTDALLAQDQHTDDLLAIDGVVGTGVSWDRSGNPVIKVYTNKGGKKGPDVPASLDGITVRAENIGNVYALNISCENRSNGKDGGCKGLQDTPKQSGDGSSEPLSPSEWHERPVPIGVSIGASSVDSNAPATLGCRVSAGCHSYVLTNSHVAGEAVVAQPAAIDGGAADDAVANLYQATSIDYSFTANNVVDAAIFDVVNGKAVDTATRADGYGKPKAFTRAAELDLDVQKYGRTTALTNGYIDAINVTIIVNYESGPARFVDQLVIKSDDTGADFALPGDSGALVVADGGDDDRMPIGLLFASGKRVAVANPIDDVLNELGINIDGDFE